jgi:hypothetical protein
MNGFRTFVVAVDVGADGQDEFFQVAEYATPEPILSRVAKKAFRHVEPRCAVLTHYTRNRRSEARGWKV